MNWKISSYMLLEAPITLHSTHDEFFQSLLSCDAFLHDLEASSKFDKKRFLGDVPNSRQSKSKKKYFWTWIYSRLEVTWGDNFGTVKNCPLLFTFILWILVTHSYVNLRYKSSQECEWKWIVGSYLVSESYKLVTTSLAAGGRIIKNLHLNLTFSSHQLLQQSCSYELYYCYFPTL